MSFRVKVLLIALAFAASLAIPFVVSEYWCQIAILTWDSVVVAIAWNLLVGTGQISLGHAGFFGLGAYAASLLFLKFNIPIVLAIACGAISALLSAVPLGFICLRMRGVYLAITTLVFAEALRTLAIMLPGLTNGSVGLSLPQIFDGNTVRSYYAVLLMVVLCCAATVLIRSSSWGYAFSAVRGNEEAASTLGINPVKYKVIGFCLSALMTGLAGAYYAFFVGYIAPPDVFNPFISIKGQVMPLVGGLYTVSGPIIGGLALGFLGEVLRTMAGQIDELIYGALLVAFVLLWPRGIVGFFSRITRKRSRPATEEQPTSGPDAEQAVGTTSPLEQGMEKGTAT